MSDRLRRVITFTAPHTVEVVEEPLRTPDVGEVLVETALSAVSPGTETLIYSGKAPATMIADSSIEAISGALNFPIQYGYAAVGRVIDVGADVRDDWLGRRVFSFQPHASHFLAGPDALVPLEDAVSFSDGVMIPSLETAINLVMDARAMLGERVVVFGQGVIGLLTTDLLSRHPLGDVYTVDPVPNRRTLSTQRGATRAFDPDEEFKDLCEELNVSREDAPEASEGEYEGADLVFELSGRPSVLQHAVSITGFDGRIVVGSWYGKKTTPLNLGTRFHRSRIEIISSQVSSIDPDHRGRWTKERRMSAVSDLLEEVRPGELISTVYRPEEAEKVYDELDQAQPGVLQPVFQYQ